jgi:hypothetical protein
LTGEQQTFGQSAARAGSGLTISQNYSARNLSNAQEISLLGFRVTEANRNEEQKCSQ